MYKFQTAFKNFRFDEFYRTGIITVTWFKLERDEEDNDSGVPFTYEELKIFESYTVSNTINFPEHYKNYHPSEPNDAELPYCSMIANIQSTLMMPNNIILKKEPTLLKKGIFKCMEIILTDDNQNDRHNYLLDFNVIGKINS